MSINRLDHTFRLAFIRRKIRTTFKSQAVRTALLAELNTRGPDSEVIVRMIEKIPTTRQAIVQPVQPIPQPAQPAGEQLMPAQPAAVQPMPAQPAVVQSMPVQLAAVQSIPDQPPSLLFHNFTCKCKSIPPLYIIMIVSLAQSYSFSMPVEI